MSSQKYFYGVGRRKACTARAKYFPGAQELDIKINKRTLKDYFSDYFAKVLLEAISKIGLKEGNIEFFINGGGTTGQVEAARLAMAKALAIFNPELKPLLRQNGYITTDNRKVLPKRPGKRKNRKIEQWSKR